MNKYLLLSVAMLCIGLPAWAVTAKEQCEKKAKLVAHNVISAMHGKTRAEEVAYEVVAESANSKLHRFEILIEGAELSGSHMDHTYEVVLQVYPRTILCKRLESVRRIK